MGGRLCFVVATSVGNATATYKPGAISLVDGMRGTFRAPLPATQPRSRWRSIAPAAKNVRKINGYPLVDGDKTGPGGGNGSMTSNSDTIVWIKAAGVNDQRHHLYHAGGGLRAVIDLHQHYGLCRYPAPSDGCERIPLRPGMWISCAQGGTINNNVPPRRKSTTPPAWSCRQAPARTMPATTRIALHQRGMNSKFDRWSSPTDEPDLAERHGDAKQPGSIHRRRTNEGMPATRARVLERLQHRRYHLGWRQRFDTGAEAASTWYYLWGSTGRRRGSITAVTGASGTDGSPTPPITMPANAPVKFGGTPPAFAGDRYDLLHPGRDDQRLQGVATPNGAAIRSDDEWNWRYSLDRAGLAARPAPRRRPCRPASRFQGTRRAGL